MAANKMVMNSVYCMTKAFVTMISQSVWWEFKLDKAGIDILDYRPAFVSTKLSQKKASLFVVTTKQATVAALDDLGQTMWTNGPFVHHLTEWGGRFAEFFVPKIYNNGVYKESKVARKTRKG